MNKAIAILLCASAVMPIFADTSTNATLNVEDVISETVKVIEAEGWTARDVADAIRSLRGLYLRDNATKEGRVRWHGKIVGPAVVTTNGTTLVKVTTHEDGETFTDEAQITPTAQSVQAANAKLAKPVTTNGVPVKLAAARLRRQAEAQSVSNVTVTVTAGGK